MHIGGSASPLAMSLQGATGARGGAADVAGQAVDWPNAERADGRKGVLNTAC